VRHGVSSPKVQKEAHEQHTGHSWPDDIDLITSVGGSNARTRERWKRNVHEYVSAFDDESHRESQISRSAMHALTYSVYRAGILIPSAWPPQTSASESEEPDEGFLWIDDENSLPVPRITVNIPQTQAPRVDFGENDDTRQE